jgi:outer membrane protein assembly factor BamB
LEDGSTLMWFARGPLFYGIPLLTNDLVVVGGFGSVSAFERSTCTLRWRADVGGDMSADGPPLVVDNTILAPQGDLVALDRETGDIVWRWGGVDGLAGEGTPVASGDTVFTGTRGGWVTALLAHTGLILWETHYDSLAIFEPTVADDALILGTRTRLNGTLGAGYVVALNKSDGSERWRFPLPDSAGIPGGAINSGTAFDGTVIIGSVTTRLYALDIETGELIWEHAPEVDDLASATYVWPPRLLNETLIVVRADEVTEALSPVNGSLLWTLDQGVYTAVPAIKGGLAYFFNDVLTIVDEDGRRIWSGGGQLATSRGYVQGTVADDGTIYAVALHLTGEGSLDLVAIRVPDLP